MTILGLIGIYFGFFFFLGRRKRKSIQGQITLRTVQTLPLKKSDKDPNCADQKEPNENFGINRRFFKHIPVRSEPIKVRPSKKSFRLQSGGASIFFLQKIKPS
jgi:hypothetical protein